MTTVNWGLLQKSAVDNETVEGAINRLIAVHESDPTAHLGTGESLEAHKSDSIIDHPAGSVLSDKKQNTQLEISTSFESYSGWTKSGTTTDFLFGALVLGTNTTLNNSASVLAENLSAFKTVDFDNNLMFQTTFSTDLHGAGDYIIKLGIDDFGGTYNTIGIKIVDNVATGYFLDGATEHTVALGTLTRGGLYTLRVFINKSTGFVEFYLNGVLSGQIAYQLHYSTDENIYFEYKATQKRTAYEAYLFVSDLLISRDIPKPVTLLDSYDSSYYDSNVFIENAENGSYLGQSFLNPTLAYLDSVKFMLAKSNSPTGNAVVRIYEMIGTFGTDSKPTGSPLATSENFDVSTLTTSVALVTFSFIGANQIILNADSHYVAVIEYTGASGANHVILGVDFTTLTADGNFSFSDDGLVWSSDDETDCPFYVYGRPI